MKLEIELPFDLAIPFLGVYPKDPILYLNTERLAQPGSLLLYSQYLGNDNNLDIYQLLNG